MCHEAVDEVISNVTNTLQELPLPTSKIHLPSLASIRVHFLGRIENNKNTLFIMNTRLVSSFSETGFYIPKAYYTIDVNGYKSPLIYIDSVPVSKTTL